MALPTALFAFSPDGLSITFEDRSSGNPAITAWSWDFGYQVASVEQVSTVQNPPAVVFPLPGVYTVKLVVTNATGTASYSFDLLVTTIPNMESTIKEMVIQAIGPISWDETGYQTAQMKWMLWLQPAAEIDDDDVFNEELWPPLYRVLISKFIVYDLILKAANQAMLTLTGASSSAITGGTSTASKGALKALESGPSKAQWYDPSAFWSAVFKSAAQGGGIFSQLLSDICLFSRRLTIQVPFCGPGPKTVRPFIIARGRCQPEWDAKHVTLAPFPGPFPFWSDQQW